MTDRLLTRQQVEERTHRARLHRLRPRDVARDEAGGRKHRLDGGSVDLEFGSQHEDIRGLQVVVGIEQREQAVVQDLGLTHR